MSDYEDDDDRESGRSRGGLQERLRRTISSGLEAAGLTEEAVIKNIKGMKITQEAAEYFSDQTKKAREETIEHAVDEIKKVLLSEEVQESALEMLGRLKVKLEISFSADEKVKVSVKSKKKVKNSKK